MHDFLFTENLADKALVCGRIFLMIILVRPLRHIDDFFGPFDYVVCGEHGGRWAGHVDESHGDNGFHFHPLGKMRGIEILAHDKHFIANVLGRDSPIRPPVAASRFARGNIAAGGNFDGKSSHRRVESGRGKSLNAALARAYWKLFAFNGGSLAVRGAWLRGRNSTWPSK